MKKAFIIPFFALLLIGSCKKNTANTNGNYSNWKLTTSNNDNGSYNAHPNDVISSEGEFFMYGNHIALSCDGFVDSSNTYNKTSQIFISFNKKPSTTRAYKIGNKNSLTDSTCYINLSALGSNNDYNSSTSGQTVNVTVSEGKVTASFSNIALTGFNMSGTQQWPASVSGTVIEGK
jgi:hypothetical protein